jgi:hypothetical protein
MRGDRLAQPELSIGLRQPTEPSVGGEASTIEGGLELKRRGFKMALLCGTIAHWGTSSFGRFSSNQTVYRSRVPLFNYLYE